MKMEPSQLIIKGSEIQDHQLISNGRVKIAEMKELTGIKAAKFRRMDDSMNEIVNNGYNHHHDDDDDDVEKINGLIWNEYDAVSIIEISENDDYCFFIFLYSSQLN